MTGGLAPMQEGVTMKALVSFLFPQHLEHPESTGRLDLFAFYGPCDDNGCLRGGPSGQHVHTDLEIRHMITELNQEQLYSLISRPRETVETMVNEILPKAVSHHYTDRDITRLFAGISPDDSGRYKFADMQGVILADQRRRLLTLIKGGEIAKASRRAIPFQSKPAQILQAITRRKKLRPNEEMIARVKRMNAYSSLTAPLEQQNLSNAIAGNVLLVRQLGDVDDRWDRYCAVRRTGKVSYVGARNSSRTRFAGDDSLADKAPMGSTLTASSSLNGPLGRRC
jgi:hypothetical protein